jgi:hypothetical protein
MFRFKQDDDGLSRAEGENTVPANDPQDERSETNIPSGYSRTVILLLIGLVVAACVGAIAAYYTGVNPIAAVTSGSSSAEIPEVLGTEQEFLKSVASISTAVPVSSEWREARADHKIIAYAIANCKQVRDKLSQFADMPPRWFSLLLLDLTPVGGHEFYVKKASVELASKSTADDKNAKSTDADSKIKLISANNSAELTHYEQSMLFLSDAIARARLEAANQADSTTSKAIAFGWITVALSGLATLFVAIKASMRSPKETGESRTYLGMFYAVGFLAMLISATVTVLSSAKQFYDPQRTYKSSEAALLELRKLQNQVSFEFIRTWDNDNCRSKLDETSSATSLNKWSNKLANIEGIIVEAAANLQDTDLLKSDDLSKPDGEKPPALPTEPKETQAQTP